MNVILKENLVYKHFQVNVWLYIFSSICLCTGIVFGVYAVKYMDSGQKSILLSYVSNITRASSQDNIQILFQAIKNNVLTIIIVWVLGLTMIGLPIILLMDLVKGFSLGFTIAFFINGMGVKGIWLSLLSLLPQNIIYIPCIIVASVISMKFSIMLMHNYGKNQWTTSLLKNLLVYSCTFILIFFIMFIGFSFEAFLSPKAVKLFSYILGSGIIEI